jgi:hypothetical protein
VGDKNEKEYRQTVVKKDKEYQIRRLERQVDIMINQIAVDHPVSMAEKISIRKQFYEDVKEKINNYEIPITTDFYQYAKEKAAAFENYFLNANYASFLSVQDGHFELHSSIYDWEIKRPDPTYPKQIEVKYLSEKDESEFRKKIVRDPGEKDLKTIVERLIGSEEKEFKDGYVLKELSTNEEFLKWLHLRGVIIECRQNQGKKIYSIGWREENGRRKGVSPETIK